MRTVTLALATTLGLTILTPANADWPAARHDFARTALAESSNLPLTPTPFWRGRLGGNLPTRAFYAADIDKDAKVDFTFLVGGRLYATAPNGLPKWATGPYDLIELYGSVDLDGDGVQDIIARSRDRVAIFNGSTGALEWREPAGEMGTIGAVRIGDLNNDGKPDVLVEECGNCAVRSGKTAFAYSFAKGMTAPTLVWTAPFIHGSANRSTIIVDVNGDGKNELFYPDETKLHLFDVGTGTELAVSAAIDPFFILSTCIPKNIDGQPGDELICWNNFPAAKPRAHRVFALRASLTDKKVTEIWSRDVGDVDGGLGVSAEVVADLDADGKLEVVVSGTKTDGSPVTDVIDAATGALLASTSGVGVLGLVELEAKGTATILAATAPAYTNLTGLKFARGTMTLTTRFDYPASSAFFTVDRPRHQNTAWNSAITAADLDGDGLQELIVATSSEVSAHSYAGGTDKVIGKSPVAADTPLAQMWVVPAVSGTRPQLVTSRVDGRVVGYTATMAVDPAIGLAVGGYNTVQDLFNAPIAAKLGSTAAASLLVVDSRGALVRFDYSPGDSLAVPPAPKWQRRGTSGALVHRVGATPRIFAIGSENKGQTLVELGADGADIRKTDLEGRVLSALIAGKFGPAGTPGVVVPWGRATDFLMYLTAYDADSGAKLWTSPEYAPGSGRSPTGFSAVDYDKDGKDDVVLLSTGLRVVSGMDGKELAVGTTAAGGYGMPTVFDVDKDGKPEVMLHARQQPVEMFGNDLKTKWISKADDTPLTYGAVALCPDGPVFIGGSLSAAGRLRFNAMTGATAGEDLAIVLASGKVYADAAAADAAGATPGRLSGVTVLADSAKSTSLALVGSSDGLLYGIDACKRSILFTYDFGQPVGDPIVADFDGDGTEDIIVTVNDGYVYALHTAPVAAPTKVIDLAPGATGGDDIDATNAVNAMAASWTASPVAASYEVAIAEVAGTYVTKPEWRDVGNVTKITVEGLNLTVGKQYVFAVRAIDSTGRKSVDSVSDGVLVTGTSGGDAGTDASLDGEPPAPEESSGCSCRFPGPAASFAGWSVLIAIGAFLLRTRRR